jgi:hypothetical protein
VKEHLKRFHSAMTTHHERLSEDHADMASSLYAAAAGSENAGMKAHLKKLGRFHERMVSRHSDIAALHKEFGEALGSSSGDEMPNVGEETRTGGGFSAARLHADLMKCVGDAD